MARSGLLGTLTLAVLFSNFSYADDAKTKDAKVLSVTPTGSVKKVQQVVARFSSDMTAMGDPRSSKDPFELKCNVASKQVDTYGGGPVHDAKTIPSYTTRWADNRSWSLDFTEPLKSGIRCSVVPKPDLKDLAGNAVTAAGEFSFTTGGPALLGIAPVYGDIEPDQYFVAQVDGDIDPKSVEKYAYFEVQGTADKVPVTIVTSKTREAVVAAAIKTNWRWSAFRELLEQKPKIPFSKIEAMDSFLVLASKRRFPEERMVTLHWPKQILSKTGVAVEEEQKFDFKVIPDFKAKFTCERTNPGRPCNPILGMKVEFTRRIPFSKLADFKLVSADGKMTWKAELPREKNEHVDDVSFKGPFPESAKLRVHIPALKDELGRKLANQNKFPLEVATDEYSPLIKFSAPFGVLELKADPVLPVSVRNIESPVPANQLTYEGKSLALSNAGEIIDWYNKVVDKDRRSERRGQSIFGENQGTKFSMPKPLGAREFELVGIPFKKPGFYVVELSSPKLGEVLLGSGTMYVASGALVTDMAVHFKKGRESSLVWVTSLSNAKPVGGAKISVRARTGEEIATGTTAADGTLRLKELPNICSNDTEDYYSNRCAIFVFAQKGDDVSFASSDWDQGIENYRFSVSSDWFSQDWGPTTIHTILDRMAAQPGDTVNMKHVLREYHENGFSMMDQKKLPKRVLIVHSGSQKTYTLPFEFDAGSGTAIGKFAIPKDATLGTYYIYLSNKEKVQQAEGGDGDAFDYMAKTTGSFVVSEYRLPLMKASLKIQGEPLVRPASVKVDLSASYLSGGPAKGLDVKLRAQLGSGHFTPDVPGGNEYTFFSDTVKTGIVSEENRGQQTEESYLEVQSLRLNDDGGLLATVKKLPAIRMVKQLSLEMEYSDPNGEIKTASSSVPLFPADYAVGLKPETSWYAHEGKTKLSGVVTDIKGKPKKDRAYTVEAFQVTHITHRKRLVGGFYSYDSKTSTKALGKVCEGKSDQHGRFVCEPKKLPPGGIKFQAKTSDDKGRATYASVSVFVYEPGSDYWFTPSDSDRIDLIPEKNGYEPEEKARFAVRSPFQESTVLVTVEREGVLDSFVTEIKRDSPMIEVPLKGHYAPNVFISALVLRGRVGDPKPTALLDLARPSMKMGLTEIKVGWRHHELKVDVKADKTKYRTREKAQITVQVKTAMGQKLPEGTELAVAAVDEALLRLKENSSWKVLREMMGSRGTAVTTSSAQNQVIGKRHFGSKAKPPGGGGGLMMTENREQFEPMLLWVPKLKVDKNGEAKITVPLNDSITSFRIAAMATSLNHFGDGKVSVETSKDLIIYSGFAPMIREGDMIKNAFTVRNTTAKPMKVALSVVSKEISSLPKLADIELKPSEAKTIDIPVKVPPGLKQASFNIKAKDAASGSEDSLIAKVRVDESVPARVLQATLFQLEKSNQIPVKQPADAIAGKGGLSVSAKSSLVSGLAGVRSYMEDYPYTCLEQKVSRSIALETKDETKKLIDALPTYLDGQGLLKFFPVSICGSPQLTRYVMNILNANDFEIPEATKTQLTKGLGAYVEGRYACRSWWDDYVRDQYQSEAKILAIETLSRYGAFNPAFLSTVQITPNLWKNETAVAWYWILKRETEIKDRDTLLKQAEQILLSRLNFQGSLMNLQGDLDWEGEWRLFSSRDQEALGVFGVGISEDSWKGDVGRLARGIVARLKRGKWDTTMANAWGVTMMRKFSAKFESEKVAGLTKVSAAEVSGLFNWQTSPFGEKKLFSWPKDSMSKDVKVEFSHEGAGKPWIHFETVSAIPLKAPLNLGYSISRKYVPVVQADKSKWSIGDVVNIEVTVTAKADQPWVVIRDPIPAGSSHLGTGLDGSSSQLDRVPKKGAADTQEWPTEYEEKSHSYFISYAAYLPRGTYRTNYRVRLNSAGEFKLPPSRVEAMYSPESFGEAPNAVWKVEK